MRAWRLPAGCTSVEQLDLLECHDRCRRQGRCWCACTPTRSIIRDQAIAKGHYFGGAIKAAGMPLSDGAGVIEAVGAGVKAFATGRPGRRLLLPGLAEGPPTPAMGEALGCPPAKGMLAEYVALPAAGVVKLAGSLSFEEAATLPCAGVTAWNALMKGVRPLTARPYGAADRHRRCFAARAADRQGSRRAGHRHVVQRREARRPRQSPRCGCHDQLPDRDHSGAPRRPSLRGHRPPCGRSGRSRHTRHSRCRRSASAAKWR